MQFFLIDRVIQERCLYAYNMYNIVENSHLYPYEDSADR
jgi:hypothetical protein